MARVWAEEGHEVHVLSGLPCYPTGVVPPQYRDRVVFHELIEGVRVHRTWIYATPNAGKARRSAMFVSYLVTTAILGRHVIPVPDVVVATSPHILAGLSGALIARKWRRPFVFEVRDLWPRSIWEVGAMSQHNPIVRGLEQLELSLYRAAAKVVVVTESFRVDIASRVKSMAEVDMPVIFNGVDLSQFEATGKSAELRAELGLPAEGPIALYAGTIGMAHGLPTVIQAARLRPEVHWVIVGEGACKADIEKEAASIENAFVLPGQPKSQMAGLYEMSSVCLVPLRDLPLFETVIPSKIFEIWAMRRPLVLGVRGESASLVKRSGGGRVVEPEDPAALAEAVREIVSNPAEGARLGEVGRGFVERHFDRRILARRYLQVLKDVVGEWAGDGPLPWK